MSNSIIDQDYENMYDEELPDDENLKKAAISKLKSIIAKEYKKPESEQNIDLIDDSIKNIAELNGIRAEHNPEELRQKSQKLLKRAKSNPTAAAVPKQARRKMRIAALVAAALILVCSISVCAFNPDVKYWLLKVIKMPMGSQIEANGITFVKLGNTTEYSSVEMCLISEGISVYYPMWLPNESTIERVSLVKYPEGDAIIYSISDDSTLFTITLTACEDPYKGNSGFSKEIINNFTVYFSLERMNNKEYAIVFIDGAKYEIASIDKESIIKIINGLIKVD